MEADREITYCVNGDPYDRKEEFKCVFRRFFHA